MIDGERIFENSISIAIGVFATFLLIYWNNPEFISKNTVQCDFTIPEHVYADLSSCQDHLDNLQKDNARLVENNNNLIKQQPKSSYFMQYTIFVIISFVLFASTLTLLILYLFKKNELEQYIKKKR